MKKKKFLKKYKSRLETYRNMNNNSQKLRNKVQQKLTLLLQG